MGPKDEFHVHQIQQISQNLAFPNVLPLAAPKVEQATDTGMIQAITPSTRIPKVWKMHQNKAIFPHKNLTIVYVLYAPDLSRVDFAPPSLINSMYFTGAHFDSSNFDWSIFTLCRQPIDWLILFLKFCRLLKRCNHIIPVDRLLDFEDQ